MRVYKINDNKFKSIYVSYNLTVDVTDTKLYSKGAVLAALMAKSSEKYKTQKEIEKYLNYLYSSVYDVNIEKLGDLYNLEIRAEFINKEYLPNHEELLDKMLEFLEDMIYHPAKWSAENIEREKQFIIERINERKDEKLKYGIQRAEEILCEGEPFGTYLYGSTDVVEKVGYDDVEEAYKNITNGCVTVIVSGNLTGYEDIDKKIENRFKKYVTNDTLIEDLVYDKKLSKSGEYKEVKEYQDTTQSVLSLGLRLNNCTPDDFYKISIYNAILGTTPSSKLFQNVREKESLAYTVRSRYYRFKDIIIIFAGINKENYDKALSVINKQITDLKEGKITDEEFTSAKDSLLADLLEWNDSKIAMAKMKISNLVAFKSADISIEQMRKAMSDVSFSDVVEIANRVSVEKVFLLGGVENA